MHIIHVAAELAPIAKVGGLGDVVLGLSRAFLKMGHQVEIILPKYDCLDLPNIRLERKDLKSFEGGEWHLNSVWSAEVEGCKVIFLEPQHRYFKDGKIYSGDPDIPKFIYFSRLTLEYLQQKKEPIDILHLHDWHVAIAAPLFKDMYRPLGLPLKAVVLNIHNLEYQGKCSVADLDNIGLDGKKYLTPDKLQDDNPAYPKSINLLKGAIVYADQVITVSPNYAREILTVEMAFNMEITLRKHENKIMGILNGIDKQIWSPKMDPFVPFSYSNENTMEEIQEAKKNNKRALQKQRGLNEYDKPLVVCVSRLVEQKGPDLIKEGLLYTLQRGGQCGLLGFAPLPKLQTVFNALQTKYRDNKNIFFDFHYNDALSRLMYAAADFVLVPSLFEPCGLTQLIALRYGAVPIVRRTGGLADTVFDAQNGYTFDTPDSLHLHAALDRAFTNFPTKKHLELVERGMNMDFGWEKSAAEYLKVYSKLQSRA